MKAPTLAQVAKLAGVSQATASRVLNGSDRTPRPETAELVRQAAQAIGYIPNAQAQSLAGRGSGLIGLIVHDLADPYFAAIAKGAQRAASEEGSLLLVTSTARDPLEELAAVEAFTARRAEAIVLTGSRCTRPQDEAGNLLLARALEEYRSNGGEVSVVGEPIVGTPPYSQRQVRVPNEELALRLAARLAGSASEFLIVGAEDGITTSDQRIKGFQSGLSAKGKNAEILRGTFDWAGGHAAGQTIAARMAGRRPQGLSTMPPPCILAVSDMVALGVLSGLKCSGLGVPRDALLAGFDGIEMLSHSTPSLSTVQLPLEHLGYLAAAQPSQAQPSLRASALAVTGEVRIRESTSLQLCFDGLRLR